MLGSRIPTRLHSPRAVPAEPLDPGTVLGGRYRIEARIGEGGMGYVLRARHLELDTLVAIKVVLPALATNTEAGERLLEESRSMASIHSDYIVAVHDAGRLPDGSQYLVLELVDGPDLDRVISAQGFLSSADTVAFGLDVCAGLGVAHARGIIHRDIKPENLLLATDEGGAHRIKISDFGIAKRTEHVRARALTMPSMALGSPCYMAPEQMRNATDIDGRADIWSLGIVLYEMCTGTVPFSASTPLEICTMVMTTRPKPPSKVRPGVADTLERVIARCLKLDPSDRYQTVAELAHDLALVVIPAGPESRRLVTGLRPYEDSPLGGAEASAMESRAEGRDAANERMFETRITLVTGRAGFGAPANAAPVGLDRGPKASTARAGRARRYVAWLAAAGALALVGVAVFKPAAVVSSFSGATDATAANGRRPVATRAAVVVAETVPTPATAAPTFDFQADARNSIVTPPAWIMPEEEIVVLPPPATRTPSPRPAASPTSPASPARAQAPRANAPELTTDDRPAPTEAESAPTAAAVPDSPVEAAPVEAPPAVAPVSTP